MYHKPKSTAHASRLPIEQEAWMLHRFEDHELVRLHLAPGESMETHINEWRIIFFVLSGAGSLNVAGKLYELQAEQSIAVKAGLERSWSNTGESVLELLAIKTRDKA